ncbi:DUF4315 family protein [Butyrivibrio sp. M55]|uniref:DUF4315 family protein n=1 Tax=Butyrivibrio sp. M55 TaxID=1855323 RepID=UPI0008E3F111|nr:DUF4315 family protein [Butyrivibrio sp. M55]SFU95811.1 protein of unknown function [Butyrivibrio sp. M55]
MFERIDRLRDELERAKMRRAEAEARVKACENKLKEAENNQIISEVAKRKLRPEELAKLLQMASDGRLEALLSGSSVEDAAEAYDAGSATDYDESEEIGYEET